MTRPSATVLLASVALLACDPAFAYQTSDLAGAWRFHSLASGPGAPWWERASLAIAANGVASGTASYSDGGSSPIAGTFAVGATGVVTIAPLPTFRGALDADHSVLVATDTWSGPGAGTTELKIGLKSAAGAALPDLAGSWEIHSIASGPGAPWWQRGRIAVGVNGDFSGTFTESDGSVGPVNGAFAMAPDGTITFDGSATAQGALDSGGTVVAMTSTWSGFAAGTTDLTVGVKMAPSYAPADLAGTWELAIFATGPGAPWWSRGTITIAADGSYSGTMTESTGASQPESGTLAVSPSGVVTRSGSATGRGALDLGRNVFVVTDTWSAESPGTSELAVAVRTAYPTADAPDAGTALALEPVRPNPSRGGAPMFHFTLAGAAPARLELVDVTGRSLMSRDVGSAGAGRHTVRLDRGLSPGLYWVRLRQCGEERVSKLVVLDGGR